MPLGNDADVPPPRPPPPPPAMHHCYYWCWRCLLLLALMMMKVGCNAQTLENPTGFFDAADGAFTLRWRVNLLAQTIAFEMSAQTNGWIGIGFAAAGKGGHNRTDTVVAWINQGDLFLLDNEISNSQERPELDDDGRRNTRDLFRFQRDGRTTIAFARDLVTGDRDDIEISDSIMSVSWAYGSTDGNRITREYAMHTRRGVTQINLLNPSAAPSTNPPTTAAAAATSSPPSLAAPTTAAVATTPPPPPPSPLTLPPPPPAPEDEQDSARDTDDDDDGGGGDGDGDEGEAEEIFRRGIRSNGIYEAFEGRRLMFRVQWSLIDASEGILRITLEARTRGWLAIEWINPFEIMTNNAIYDLVFGDSNDAVVVDASIEDVVVAGAPQRQRSRSVDQSRNIGDAVISSSGARDDDDESGGFTRLSFTRAIISQDRIEDVDISEYALVALSFGPSSSTTSSTSLFRELRPAAATISSFRVLVPGMFARQPLPQGRFQSPASSFTAEWWISASTNQLLMVVEAATTGWIGVGWSRQPRGHDGCDAVVGWVDDRSAALVTLADTFSQSRTRPSIDSRSDVVFIEGSQIADTTSLVFVRALRTVEAEEIEQDISIINASAQEPLYLVWAFAELDGVNLNSFQQHQQRGIATVVNLEADAIIQQNADGDPCVEGSINAGQGFAITIAALIVVVGSVQNLHRCRKRYAQSKRAQDFQKRTHCIFDECFDVDEGNHDSRLLLFNGTTSSNEQHNSVAGAGGTAAATTTAVISISRPSEYTHDDGSSSLYTQRKAGRAGSVTTDEPILIAKQPCSAVSNMLRRLLLTRLPHSNAGSASVRDLLIFALFAVASVFWAASSSATTAAACAGSLSADVSFAAVVAAEQTGYVVAAISMFVAVSGAKITGLRLLLNMDDWCRSLTLHRWSVFWLTTLSVVHGIFAVVGSNDATTKQKIGTGVIAVVALFSMTALLLGTAAVISQRLQRRIHHGITLGFFIAAFFHASRAREFFWVVLALVLLEGIARAGAISAARQWQTPHQFNLIYPSVLRLRFAHNGRGRRRTGEHVLIQLDAGGMTSGDAGNHRGRWIRAYFSSSTLAQLAEVHCDAFKAVISGASPSSIRFRLHGPYGGFKRNFARYSMWCGICLQPSVSGISPIVSMLKHTYELDLLSTTLPRLPRPTRLRHVYLLSPNLGESAAVDDFFAGVLAQCRGAIARDPKRYPVLHIYRGHRQLDTVFDRLQAEAAIVRKSGRGEGSLPSLSHPRVDVFACSSDQSLLNELWDRCLERSRGPVRFDFEHELLPVPPSPSSTSSSSHHQHPEWS